MRVVTVVESLVVLNFTVSCTIDGMACSLKRVGRPRIISCFDLCLTIDNSIVRVTLSFPLWLSSVNERFMVPIFHSFCPVKPMNGDQVGGFRLLF